MRSAAALLVSITFAAGALEAQGATPTDVFTGRVTDLAGRPVAEAQVEVVSLKSNLTRTQLTDSTGRYRIVFPEHAPLYQVTARRLGFSPVQGTLKRGSAVDERFLADLQFVGAPVALSMVEVTGDIYRPLRRADDKPAAGEATVPNPVADILALRDTLHLSAVQILGLRDLADSLHAKNSALFRGITNLITKLKENGDATDMAGTVSLMLQEASSNSDRAVQAAEKLLRPEQWILIPKGITERRERQETSEGPAR
jgi:hypothetical protein